MNAPFKFRADLRLTATVFASHLLDISEEALVSAAKTKDLVEARALFVWAIKTHRPATSYTQLGAWLGGRDHSTIVNLHQKAIALRIRDADFDQSCRRFAAVWADLTENSHACS